MLFYIILYSIEKLKSLIINAYNDFGTSVLYENYINLFKDSISP